MVSQGAVTGGGVTFPLPISGDTRTTLGPHHDRRAELLQGQDRLHHRGHGLHWQDHHREASQVGQEVTISLQSSELEAQNIVSILIISLSLQMHRCWQDLHSYPREEGCVAGCAAGDAGQVQGDHVKYRSTGCLNRSPLFELLRAEKPGAWSRVAALTGDIEEDMLGLGPGELVTTYLSVKTRGEASNSYVG